MSAARNVPHDLRRNQQKPCQGRGAKGGGVMPRRKRKYTQQPTTEAAKTTATDPWPRFMNAKTAARYMDFGSTVTFWRWAKACIADGLLHPDTSMRSWRYDRLELERAFEVRSGKVASLKTKKVVSTATATSPTDEFITVKQLSERLHVTKSTIWNWCRRRNRDPLPHFAISSKVVLFRWSDVVKWVEGRAA